MKENLLSVKNSKLKFSWQFNDYSELKKVLDEKGYSYKDLGYELIINYRGEVYLPSLNTLPDNIKFNTKGEIYLNSLTTLPDNIQFNNGGNVFLTLLTTLPDNIQFNNRRNIYLPSLISLPDNIKFNNGGSIYFDSLTSLPENKYEIFHNKGKVYYNWNGSIYKEFNPHERNASLKFSWQILEPEIIEGKRYIEKYNNLKIVTVIRSESTFSVEKGQYGAWPEVNQAGIKGEKIIKSFKRYSESLNFAREYAVENNIPLWITDDDKEWAENEKKYENELKSESSKKSSIFICLWTPNSVRKRLKSIKELDNDLHMTLVYRPNVRLTKEKNKELLNKISKIAKDYRKLRLKFGGTAEFNNENKSYVALLNIKEGPELYTKLVQAIEDVYGKWDREFGFIPHVTVFQEKKNKNLPDIKPFSWSAKHIGVVFGNSEDESSQQYLIELKSGKIEEIKKKIAWQFVEYSWEEFLIMVNPNQVWQVNRYDTENPRNLIVKKYKYFLTGPNSRLKAMSKDGKTAYFSNSIYMTTPLSQTNEGILFSEVGVQKEYEPFILLNININIKESNLRFSNEFTYADSSDIDQSKSQYDNRALMFHQEDKLYPYGEDKLPGNTEVEYKFFNPTVNRPKLDELTQQIVTTNKKVNSWKTFEPSEENIESFTGWLVEDCINNYDIYGVIVKTGLKDMPLSLWAVWKESEKDAIESYINLTEKYAKPSTEGGNLYWVHVHNVKPIEYIGEKFNKESNVRLSWKSVDMINSIEELREVISKFPGREIIYITRLGLSDQWTVMKLIPATEEIYERIIKTGLSFEKAKEEAEKRAFEEGSIYYKSPVEQTEEKKNL